MTTNQTERVSDEELDQMIWKLERDGMTPKMLSLMREVREVRREKGEPVAWLLSGGGAKNDVRFDSSNAYADPLREVTPLYAAPQLPQPAVLSVSEGVLKSLLPDVEKSEFWFEHNGKIFFEGVRFNNAVFEACRAAMLSSRNSEQLEPVSNRDELPVTQFKPVADLYGITSPTGSETIFTFDAVEARDFIDGGWSCQEYVELERYQAAMTNQSEQVLDMVNSPATPDGWILVSERVPEEYDYDIWVYSPSEGVQHGAAYEGGGMFTDDECQFRIYDATHWMPMIIPAGPKEVG